MNKMNDSDCLDFLCIREKGVIQKKSTLDKIAKQLDFQIKLESVIKKEIITYLNDQESSATCFIEWDVCPRLCQSFCNEIAHDQHDQITSAFYEFIYKNTGPSRLFLFDEFDGQIRLWSNMTAKQKEARENQFKKAEMLREKGKALRAEADSLDRKAYEDTK